MCTGYSVYYRVVGNFKGVSQNEAIQFFNTFIINNYTSC